MEGDLLLRAETVVLLATVLILGGGFLYWGYTSFKEDGKAVREQSDVLSCSQKQVEMVSYRSNATHFTAYLESTSDFQLKIYGDGNETVSLEESSTAQKITVKVSSVSNVDAVFPGCDRTVDLL